MIALSVPHSEEFDENESFDESITDTINNELDESNISMDESTSFLKEIMPRKFNKYGK